LAQEPLEQLLSETMAGCTVHGVENIQPDEYDFAFPLLSLPRYFKTDVTNIPNATPYLTPPRQIAAAWRKTLERYDVGGRLRVGIIWAGNPNHPKDQKRSIEFTTLTDLFNIPDISWISIQAGERARDLQNSSCDIFDCSTRLVNFAETAGVIANIDIIISVDTAVAHLAGAMGKPTWLLLPACAYDWRWQLEQEDTPWYPTMRFFRQEKAGDWPNVLLRVKKALIRQVAKRAKKSRR
jgi:hypothetical protein